MKGKCHHAHALPAAAARPLPPSSLVPTQKPARKADAYTCYNLGQTTGRQNSIHETTRRVQTEGRRRAEAVIWRYERKVSGVHESRTHTHAQ